MKWTHLNKIQITTLIELAEKRPRDQALLAMSAYTALRIGDILKQDIADVLDECGRIRQRLVLRQKKTGRRLELNLPEGLRAILRRYLNERAITDRAEPLFINFDRNGDQVRKRGTRRLSPVGAHKIFKKYLSRALGVAPSELAGLSTHALRRSLAMMIYNEYGLRAAQELLGHASIGSTGVYLDKLLAASQADAFREGLDFATTHRTKTKPRDGSCVNPRGRPKN